MHHPLRFSAPAQRSHDAFPPHGAVAREEWGADASPPSKLARGEPEAGGSQPPAGTRSPSAPTRGGGPSCRAGRQAGSPGGTTGPRGGARRRQRDPPASTPAPSQAGPHRVAAESHRHPRGERPAEQPPCRQHRGGQQSPPAVTFTALRRGPARPGRRAAHRKRVTRPGIPAPLPPRPLPRLLGEAGSGLVTLGLLGNVVRRALLLPGATTGPLSERLLPDPAFPTSSEQALRVASCQFLVFSTF